MPNLSDFRGCEQQSGHDCGPACAAGVLRHFGNKISLQICTDYLYPNEVHGTDPGRLEAFFRSYGFKVLAGNMDLAALKWFTMNDRPVVCAIMDHWTVALKVNRTSVDAYDPALGMVVRVHDFEKKWQDVDRSGAVFDKHGLAVWI